MIEAVWESRLSGDGNGGFCTVELPAHHSGVFSRAALKYLLEHANTVAPAEISHQTGEECRVSISDIK